MNRRGIVLAAIAAATIVKLTLAIVTIGTNDVVTWKSFINNIHEAGGAGSYHLSGYYGDPFNHPPFMVHVLLFLDWISRKTNIAFPFLLRLPGILADVGTVFLIYRLQRTGILKCSQAAVMVLALCPISILVSGFHGNTDPIFVFFIVSSMYFIYLRHSEWASGFAFGMALNVKVVPVILALVFLFYIKSWKGRIGFLASAAIIVLLCSMPYLAEDPSAIIKGTLGYRGFPAPWGLWNLLHSVGPSPRIAHRSLTVIALAAAALIAPYWMHRKGLDLYTQVGVVFLLFLFLTPSFGVQYLAWAVPFILTLALREVVLYYFSAGALLFSIYNYWSGGRWYFAESHVDPPWNATSIVIAYVCWAVIGLALISYRRKIVTLNRVGGAS